MTSSPSPITTGPVAVGDAHHDEEEDEAEEDEAGDDVDDGRGDRDGDGGLHHDSPFKRAKIMISEASTCLSLTISDQQTESEA